MERPALVRKSHTNTGDLLIWLEGAPQDPAPGATPPSNRRPHQPSEAISKVMFGGQVTEEFEILNKRKPCSAPKWKELSGSVSLQVEVRLRKMNLAIPLQLPLKQLQRIIRGQFL